MLPNVGATELVALLAIILLLFGARRVPELARGLGTGIREFRRGTRGEKVASDGGGVSHEHGWKL